MSQNVLSIYITEEEIRICEVKRKGKNLQVNRVFKGATPKNSVDGGMIVDVEAMAQALQELFAAYAVKKGKLVFTIASKRIANKEVTIPYVKNKKRITEMIQANIQDYFPMGNLSEYIWRYTIVDTVKNEETGHYNIALAAVRRDMIASYYELAAELNMPVDTVDYYGNSIYSIICRQMKEGTALALQIDEDVTHVCIMEGSTQLFRRTVPHGKDALIQALAEKKGISAQDAERILTSGEEAAVTQEDCRAMISDLVASIARVMDFYTTKNQKVLVEKARLFGAGLRIRGLAQALSQELEIEVEEGLVLDGVVISKKNAYGIAMEDLFEYIPNLGAMLASLDLKAEEERKKVSGEQMLQGVVIAASLIVIILAGITFYQNYRLRDEKAALDTDNKRLEHAEEVYLAYMNLLQEYNQMEGYYNSTESDAEALHQMVLTLEEVMPRSVGIGSLSVDNGNISITGTASGKIPVADFIIELKKIPYVSDVRVSKTVDSNEGNLTEFEMSFHISIESEEREAE